MKPNPLPTRKYLPNCVGILAQNCGGRDHVFVHRSKQLIA
jgi:hypothetical protein